MRTTSRPEWQALVLILRRSINPMDNASTAREILKGTDGGSPLRRQVGARTDVMRERDFRRIALGMEGAVEGAHMGHPDFRVNNRIFATLHHNRAFGGLALTPSQQERVLREHPDAFEPASGAWARRCDDGTVSIGSRRGSRRTDDARMAEHGSQRPIKIGRNRSATPIRRSRKRTA